MAGPLVNIETQVAGIDLDITRQLYLGPNVTLEFIKSKGDEPDGWLVVRTFIDSFDRISGDESNKGEAKVVVFQIADVLGSNVPLGVPTLSEIADSIEGLFIRVGSNIYKIDRIPKLADNEAQIYTIYCQTRTSRTSYFE